ncbi:hypothetical protein CC78DRAFT_578315 [Lojkania enalia]|uniref:Probable double zinc ribbon domain-containing protein n=1 Tax=Lojkania enalia TaxID=147567 RepID=A0A9P4KEM5_9PLEO|nr:hypothetical protein CC78DRAFT_578315 [Didymosphaeria enalia]
MFTLPYPLATNGTRKAYPSKNSAAYGSWKCCYCHKNNTIAVQGGVHPLGALSCTCTHKPCEECHLLGAATTFVPIIEQLPVPLSIDYSVTGIPYGVICRDCGLSWQVIQIQSPSKVRSLLSRKRRLPHSISKLRKRTSLKVIGMVDNDGDMEIEVKTACIRFSGLKCTCGRVSDWHTLGFRIEKGKG